MNEKNISKLMGQAINDYDMIKENDRIVVGLSGGIDSLSLLILLLKRLKRIPIKYELFPVLVDNYNGENQEYNKQIDNLVNYFLTKYNVKIDIIKIPAIQKLTDESIKKKNICYFCSYKRRIELIKYAFNNSCNKIALGHHKDDVIETALMNLLYKRELSTMIPRLPLFKGKLEIIRPMVYISKNQIDKYFKNNINDLKTLEQVCPLKELKRDQRREKIKNIIKNMTKEVPDAINNIFASYRNPKSDYLLNYLYNPKTSGRFKRP